MVKSYGTHINSSAKHKVHNLVQAYITYIILKKQQQLLTFLTGSKKNKEKFFLLTWPKSNTFHPIIQKHSRNFKHLTCKDLKVSLDKQIFNSMKVRANTHISLSSNFLAPAF